MRAGANPSGVVSDRPPGRLIVVFCLVLAVGNTPAWASLVFGAVPVSTRASSQFDTTTLNAPSKLFDGTISLADLGTTNNLGGQYASSGTGNGVFRDNDFNPVVSMDFAIAISANSIVYAQRTGQGGTGADKVDSIRIWFTPSAFNPSLGTGNPTDNPTPPGAPDEIVNITDRTDSLLREYPFADGKTLTAAFVTMQFIGDAGRNPGSNPGGYELRLTQDSAVPEPASAYLGVIGCALLFKRRQRRGWRHW